MSFYYWTSKRTRDEKFSHLGKKIKVSELCVSNYFLHEAEFRSNYNHHFMLLIILPCYLHFEKLPFELDAFYVTCLSQICWIVFFPLENINQNDLPISGNMTGNKNALFPMSGSWELSNSSLDIPISKQEVILPTDFWCCYFFSLHGHSTLSLIKLQTLEKLQFSLLKCHLHKQTGSCHSDYQWPSYLDVIHMESNCIFSMLP